MIWIRASGNVDAAAGAIIDLAKNSRPELVDWRAGRAMQVTQVTQVTQVRQVRQVRQVIHSAQVAQVAQVARVAQVRQVTQGVRVARRKVRRLRSNGRCQERASNHYSVLDGDTAPHGSHR